MIFILLKRLELWKEIQNMKHEYDAYDTSYKLLINESYYLYKVLLYFLYINYL